MNLRFVLQTSDNVDQVVQGSEAFRSARNDLVMLLPRDETKGYEAALQIVRPGGATPSNAPETFMLIWLIWSGKACIFIGSESRKASALASGFVPLQTRRWLRMFRLETP